MVVGAGIDDDSMAATPGVLSEHERARATLVFVGKTAGEGDSEVPLYTDDGDGDGGPPTPPEVVVERKFQRSIRGRG